MTLLTLFLIFLGPFLVVAPFAVLAEVMMPGLLRPTSRPRPRPVTRPRPARAYGWAVA